MSSGRNCCPKPYTLNGKPQARTSSGLESKASGVGLRFGVWDGLRYGFGLQVWGFTTPGASRTGSNFRPESLGGTTKHSMAGNNQASSAHTAMLHTFGVWRGISYSESVYITTCIYSFIPV